MKKIIFLLLIGILTLNSCGPSAEEKAQMEREAQERRERENEARLERLHDKIIFNLENNLLNNKEKLKWNVTRIKSIDDYYIEDNSYGFLVTVEFIGFINNKYANGVKLDFYYDIVAKLKYDKNGNLIKAVSWEDTIH